MLANKNLYNDKELFDDADLDWYDYGFRNYEPQIGRFTQLDPLTDQYPELTNYQYASDEPIANVDMDGLEKLVSNFANFTYDYAKASSTFIPIASDATHIAHVSHLLQLKNVIPQVAKIGGNLANLKIDNLFKIRPITIRTGLDWQGNGALPYHPSVSNRSEENSGEKTLELGMNITEYGEYSSRLLQKSSLARKFEFGNEILTGASFVSHVASGDGRGAMFDVIDFGISKTSLAPYYFTLKTTYAFYNSDYMQSAGYQEALEDQKNAFYEQRKYKEGTFMYKFGKNK